MSTCKGTKKEYKSKLYMPEQPQKKKKKGLFLLLFPDFFIIF